jgi:hypothetical protein
LETWDRVGSAAFFLIAFRPGRHEAKELLGADDAACGDPATLVDGLKAADDRPSSLLSQ